MRYLFVHQNFPAQFVHLLRHLVRQEAHELLFLTENTSNRLAGVRKMVHTPPRPHATGIHVDVQELEYAAMRAHTVANSARRLKALGFEPDIIIGHHGWGEMLNLPDVWPRAPMLGYFEFYYRTEGVDVNFDPEFPTRRENFPRIRNKNAVNLLALENPGRGFTPTRFQHETYPAWARPRIDVLREGVNLHTCRPKPELRQSTITIAGYKVTPEEKLVTYVVRDLEPYRGFHVFMRALPRLLAERPDVRVILVGGDAVSYGAHPPRGTWRERMLDELSGKLDLSRIHFAGRVPYETYLRLLQRSDAHVYLTYPFVASWSLREALACGCAVVASDTAPVREFVSHEKTGLLVPMLEPERIAEGVLRVLGDAELSATLRRQARAWARRHLKLEDYLEEFEKLIDRTRKSVLF